MGTLDVFSRAYCAGRNTCVVVDAWLELFFLVVVCALLVASRCCWLCRRRRRRTTRGIAWRIRRLLGKCGIRVAGRTSPLPLAVIKKDATAARIHGHKNSQQQGVAFILQTQRMQHMDFAAQSPALTEDGTNEQAQAQFPPRHFLDSDDSNAMTSVVPNGCPKQSTVRSGSVMVKKRDPSKHKLSAQMTRQRSKSAMNPPKSQVSSKVRAVSISVARSSRNILAAARVPNHKGARLSGSRTDSTDSLSSDRSNSFKRRFHIFKKRIPTRAHTQALFNEPSYATKNGMAELSPEDRAENERRESMKLRDKRRVSVGVSSHVQFEVGGDQASVYEVKLREVNLVKRLATGPLSEVYAAIWRDTKVGVKLLMPREG
ncbi:Protein kinase, partial [Phytophthora palmivora]